MSSSRDYLSRSLLGEERSASIVELNESGSSQIEGSGVGSQSEPFIKLIPSKAERLLDELGLTSEDVEAAGIHFEALLNLLNTHLSPKNSFLRLISYDDVQLKFLLWPFVGKEDVRDFRTTVQGFREKINYYFDSRVWPKARAMLYKSRSALAKIATMQSFLSASGLVSAKAWTFLLLSLQINELIYYIQFFNNPSLRVYYTPFAFHPKVDANKILSQSLSQTLVWTSVLAIPLGLGLLSALYTRVTYQFDNNTVNGLISALEAYQSSWHPAKIYRIQQVIIQAQNALIWNGQLSPLQRRTLFKTVADFAANKASGITQLQALAVLGSCLTAIHSKDIERLSELSGWDDQEARQHSIAILKLKLDAYDALLALVQSQTSRLDNVSWKKRWEKTLSQQIRRVYASYLLWEAGHPQSKKSSVTFASIKLYSIYAKVILLKAIITGIQYNIDFSRNKSTCENQNDMYWRFFEVPPKLGEQAGYYCSPCADFPIQPKQKFSSQDCVWGLFNSSRNYVDLLKYLDAKHSDRALKNWEGVEELSFSNQKIQGDDLANIITIIGSRPRDLRRLIFEGNSDDISSGILFNENTVRTLSNWLGKINLRFLSIKSTYLDNMLMENLVISLPKGLSIVTLDVVQQGANFTDASILTELIFSMPNLKNLDLSNNGFVNNSLAVWVENLLDQNKTYPLQSLNLSGQQNTAEEASFADLGALSKLFKVFPNLINLKLNNNGFTDDSLSTWIGDLTAQSTIYPLKLLELNTQINSVSGGSLTNASSLADLFSIFPTLQTLNLGNNSFSNSSIGVWGDALLAANKTYELISLDLGNQVSGNSCPNPHCFTFTDASHLTKLFQAFPLLKILNLNINGFFEPGIKALADDLVAQGKMYPLQVLKFQLQSNFANVSLFSGLLDVFPSLRTLDLGRNIFSNDDLKAWSENLVSSGKTYLLESLVLSYQGEILLGVSTFSDASLLAGILQAFPNLRSLDVGVNAFTDESIKLWSESLSKQGKTHALKFLDLSFQGYPPSFKNASLLTGLLNSFPKLQVLNVAGNRFTDDSIGAWIKNLTTQGEINSLEELSLRQSNFSDAGLLAGLLQFFPGLKTLDAGYNRFTDETIRDFGESLTAQGRVYPLESLALYGQTQFTNVGLLNAVLAALPSLKKLDVDYNKIGNFGIREFSKALVREAKDLPELWLIKLRNEQNRASHTPISSTSLQWLNLQSNLIDDFGAKLLCDKISFTEINTIDSTGLIYAADDGYVAFLAENKINNTALMVCAETSSASSLDFFGLFDLMKRLRTQLASNSQSHLNIRSTVAPYVITNRHFSLPKCMGSYCDTTQQIASTQSFELAVSLYGIQATILAAVMGAFGVLLEQTSMTKDQIALSLSAIRLGINFALGFGGYGVVTRELFVHLLGRQLSYLGFDRKTTSHITTATSILMNLGLFILRARNSVMQFALITLVSMFGSWLGQSIVEGAAIHFDFKRDKKFRQNPQALFAKKRSFSSDSVKMPKMKQANSQFTLESKKATSSKTSALTIG